MKEPLTRHGICSGCTAFGHLETRACYWIGVGGHKNGRDDGGCSEQEEPRGLGTAHPIPDADRYLGRRYVTDTQARAAIAGAWLEPHRLTREKPRRRYERQRTHANCRQTSAQDKHIGSSDRHTTNTAFVWLRRRTHLASVDSGNRRPASRSMREGKRRQALGQVGYMTAEVQGSKRRRGTRRKRRSEGSWRQIWLMWHGVGRYGTMGMGCEGPGTLQGRYLGMSYAWWEVRLTCVVGSRCGPDVAGRESGGRGLWTNDMGRGGWVAERWLRAVRGPWDGGRRIPTPLPKRARHHRSVASSGGLTAQISAGACGYTCGEAERRGRQGAPALQERDCHRRHRASLRRSRPPMRRA